MEHPRAIVSPSAVVGQGSAIMAGAIVGTDVGNWGQIPINL
ncbi:hypothetical protein [Rhodoferax sp. UBA5149]|nr:hypothetical protein [Rhodoferax sp. UBA5149]